MLPSLGLPTWKKLKAFLDVTTSIVVVMLLLIGGEALRGFSEALLIGIIAGTYSSIWISGAVALSCGLKAEHVFPPVRRDPADMMP